MIFHEKAKTKKYVGQIIVISSYPALSVAVTHSFLWRTTLKTGHKYIDASTKDSHP